MKIKAPKADIGVVIGRYQVPFLHDAHRDLISYVCENHGQVIVFLGISPLRASKRNPLDYPAREKMLREAFPDVIVLPIHDHPSDEEWSKNLDAAIKNIYPFGSVVLYGGRESFMLHYFGKHQTVELTSEHIISGTILREQAAAKAGNSPDFRAGVIYGVSNTWPAVVPIVDICVWHPKLDAFLMGRKVTDPVDTWRLPGGYQDVGDSSMEHAAVRELAEETSLSMCVDDMHYVGSMIVDDWRYKNDVDKMHSSFFTAPYRFGSIAARDDLAEVKWIKTGDLFGQAVRIVEAHKPFFLTKGFGGPLPFAVKARELCLKLTGETNA